MKIKGREVIPVNFTWTLEELYNFMQEKWDKAEYGSFKVGKPTPASFEEYICLPATQNCLVIAYPRKEKIILTVADNINGLVQMAESAFPTHNNYFKMRQAALTKNHTKEMKGPAADICEFYADYMRQILTRAGLI